MLFYSFSTQESLQTNLDNILKSKDNHIAELKKLDKRAITFSKFSVVFGKVTTKKHKTYDEDGTLELKDGYVVLKNDSGKCVGTAARSKEIKEGVTIVVAGNEVLVGEPLCAPSNHPVDSSVSLKVKPKVVPVFKPPLVEAKKTNEAAALAKKGVKRSYSVVWAPLSNKKHKVWQGDGVLEVEGKVARLKDDRGKLLASEFNLKLNTLAEGDRLTIEGKELEITELQQSAESSEPKQLTSTTRLPRPSLPPFRQPDILPNLPIDTKSMWSEDSYETKNGNFVQNDPKTPEQKFTLAYPKRIEHLVPGNTPSSYYEPTEDFSSPNMITEEEPGSQLVVLNVRSFSLPPPPYVHQFKHGQGKKLQTVVVADFLAAQLRPHQREGVSFLYQAVLGFHTVNNIDCYGAILADEMGLGKSLQCITLIHTLLKQSPYGGNEANRILIVTPSSLVDNWKQEVTKWLEHERIFTFEVSAKNRPHQFAQSRHIPIMIVSYEMYARLHDEINEIDFQLLICDEGK